MSKNKSKGKRKRAHDAVAQSKEADAPSSGVGLASTIATLKNSAENGTSTPTNPEGDGARADGEATPADEGWTTVTSRKKRKISVDHDQTMPAYPSMTHSPQARLQTFTKVADIQNLVLYLFGEGIAPQWVGVTQPRAIRKVVVLMVPGLEPDLFSTSQTSKPPAEILRDAIRQDRAVDSAATIEDDQASPVLPQLPTSHATTPDHYYPKALHKDQLSDPVKSIADVFPHVWPIKSPGDERTSQIFSDCDAMLTTRIEKPEDDKNAVISGPRPPVEAKVWQDKRTRVTEFLASLPELREDLYALHPASLPSSDERRDEMGRRKTQKQTSDDGWVDSNVSSLDDSTVPEATIESDSILAGYDIIAIDCEMCQTASDPSALTRISAVGWDGDIIVDELVKPPSPVTDYLTPFSGITAEKLDPVSTTLSDIQQRLLPLLTHHTILVGHSLVSDLTALKITHPLIIDTSLLYPHPRGPPFKSALKWLCQKYLSRAIQTGHGTVGHDSIEDARATLDLVKLKCEKGPTWGTPEASRESLFKRLHRAPRPNSTLGRLSTATVEWTAASPNSVSKSEADVRLACDDDDQVVDGVRRAIQGDDDGREVPGGGVEFVFAQLHALRAVKGWWGPDRNSGMETLRLKARAKYAPPESNIDPPPQNDAFMTQFDTPLAPSAIDSALTDTIARVRAIHHSLPPTTAFIVFSGALSTQRLQQLRQQLRQHKREYKKKNWDEVTPWGEKEEQELKREFRRVRGGVGFMCVK